MRLKAKINLFLVIAFALNAAFWTGSSKIYARWAGVPPVPTKEGALIMGLGDAQFSFRYGAMTLQNLGDTGGQVTPLKDYDYAKLGEWFYLLHGLDPASDHVPMIAAYYFGAIGVPRDAAVIAGYLAHVGQNPFGSKWRWLLQAVLLARHKMGDRDQALEWAYQLSKMQPIGDTLPGWARQMPAFVLADRGDLQAARQVMEGLLLSSQSFHPSEVNFMEGYLVEQLGVSQEEVGKLMRMRGTRPEFIQGPKLPVPMPAP